MSLLNSEHIISITFHSNYSYILYRFGHLASVYQPAFDLPPVGGDRPYRNFARMFRTGKRMTGLPCA